MKNYSDLMKLIILPQNGLSPSLYIGVIRDHIRGGGRGHIKLLGVIGILEGGGLLLYSKEVFIIIFCLFYGMKKE